MARAVLANLGALSLVIGWPRRTVARSGGVRALLRDRPRPLTFVMHTFMDAADVAPDWVLLERGITSEDPSVRAKATT